MFNLGQFIKSIQNSPFLLEIQGLIVFFITIIPGTIVYLNFIEYKVLYLSCVSLAFLVATWLFTKFIKGDWTKEKAEPWLAGFFLYFCVVELIMVGTTQAESYPVIIVFFFVTCNFFIFVDSVYYSKLCCVFNAVGVTICCFCFEKMTVNAYFFVFMDICICGLGYLITLKRATNLKRLKEAQEMYQMLATNSVDIISIHDIPSNEIEYISPSIFQQTGFTAEEVIKKPYLYAIHPEDIEPYKAIYSYENFVNNESLKFRYRVKARDGLYFWLESNSRGIVENGKLKKIIAISRNIESQVASEIALQEYTHELERINRQLKASNKELEEFAYIASHDLKEPLRTVASYVQLLERRYEHVLDSEAKEYIAFATSGVKRMEELINDLLLYSKVGATKINKEYVNVTDLLTSVCERLSYKIAETKAIVEVDALPTVKGDRFQLGQLFQNLLANALTFTHPERKPHIQITVQESEQDWTFCIQDNGEGIDREYHDKVFEMFRRLHTPKEKEGSGMGLSICSRVAANHNGKLWLESSLGNGSRFYFSIPKEK